MLDNDSEALSAIEHTEGWLSLDEARLLLTLARSVQHGCIVEVGSFRGRSTLALAYGAAADVPVYAIEPHEEFKGVLGGSFGAEDRAAFFRTMLRTEMYRKVRLVNLSTEVVAPNWPFPVSLLWIDGDHRYDAVVRDFTGWERHLTDEAYLALDDARDTRLGPRQLIDRVLLPGGWQVSAEVGKVVALRRSAAAVGAA